MDTRRLWPESVIAGFVWLLAIGGVCSAILGITVKDLGDGILALSNISTSAATFLSALTLAGSYMTGTIANSTLVQIRVGA